MKGRRFNIFWVKVWHIYILQDMDRQMCIRDSLMTSPEGEAGSGDSNGEETKKEDENKNVEIRCV